MVGSRAGSREEYRKRAGWLGWGGQGERERERGLSGCGGEDRGKQRLTGVGGELAAGWLVGWLWCSPSLY